MQSDFPQNVMIYDCDRGRKDLPELTPELLKEMVFETGLTEEQTNSAIIHPQE